MKLATLLHDLFLYIPKFNFEGAYTWSANEGGDLMSRTPNCDMFLKSP